ncbi:MAG: GNAT family N-acetyltransferase [Pseudomonadota bacterium]
METARALLTDHLTWAYGKLLALGAAPFDKMRHADKFFDHLNDVLPPRGAYFLAFDPEGQALGTGSLRRISDDMAEMKHLYVRPTARGAGLGERLIAARIDAARTLGVRHLVADTFQGNDPMIRLYRQAGFSDAAPFDSAAAVTTPELIPHLRYFEMRV